MTKQRRSLPRKAAHTPDSVSANTTSPAATISTTLERLRKSDARRWCGAFGSCVSSEQRRPKLEKRSRAQSLLKDSDALPRPPCSRARIRECVGTTRWTAASSSIVQTRRGFTEVHRLFPHTMLGHRQGVPRCRAGCGCARQASTHTHKHRLDKISSPSPIVRVRPRATTERARLTPHLLRTAVGQRW